MIPRLSSWNRLLMVSHTQPSISWLPAFVYAIASICNNLFYSVKPYHPSDHPKWHLPFRITTSLLVSKIWWDFLFQSLPILCVFMGSLAQSCRTLSNPVGCSPQSAPVHGISQARILEWLAIFLFQGIFLIQGFNLRLLHCKRILYHWGMHRIFQVLYSCTNFQNVLC